MDLTDTPVSVKEEPAASPEEEKEEEATSMQIDDPSEGSYTWRLTSFSSLDDVKKKFSETFTIGGYQWR